MIQNYFVKTLNTSTHRYHYNAIARGRALLITCSRAGAEGYYLPVRRDAASIGAAKVERTAAGSGGA